MKKYKLNWKRDLVDQRDNKYLFGKVFRAPKELPAKADLLTGFSPVEDQGELGSCTGQAFVGCAEFLMIKDKAAFRDLSRLFAYYNARLLEGTVGWDAGATLRGIIKAGRRFGLCREEAWPYDISRYAKKPLPNCYDEAALHQLVAYHRLAGLQEIKASIALGLPVLFGFSVYEHVMSDEVTKTGILRVPKEDEQLLGGHAAVIAGYDDEAKMCLWRNSWGNTWGQKGYGQMPYAYFDELGLASDFWVIEATESNLYAALKVKQEAEVKPEEAIA